MSCNWFIIYTYGGVIVKEHLYYINLFDYYGSLLTEKQQEYFKDYYFNNLTLSEIAENNEISRNAVFKQIKEVCNKLNYYEDNLKMFDKFTKIRKLSENLDKNIKEKIDKICG